MAIGGRHPTVRGKELKELRERAIEELKRGASPSALARQYGLNPHTVQIWRRRYTELPQLRSGPARMSQRPSFEDILAAFPDIAALGSALVEGFMLKIAQRDNNIEALKQKNQELQKNYSVLAQDLESIAKEKLRIEKVYMQLNNEVVASRRLSSLTIDQVAQKIVRKG